MDIEKAKKILKNMNINFWGQTSCKECSYKDDKHRCFDDDTGDCQMTAIKTVLNELDKKDKIINEMAEVLNDFDYDKQCEICNTDICSACEDGTEYTKCIINYFTKKASDK